jgi:branched-chain amino acid transport system permease protein
MHKRKLTPLTRALLLLVVGAVLLALSGYVDELRTYQGAQVAVYLIAIASIILLTGYSGQISLGHGAIMAIGGYGAALSYGLWNFPLVIALVFGTVVGTCGGFILGVAAARLSGPYLAGTTLALAVGLPSVADQFKVLGGEQGLNFDIGDAPHWLRNFEGDSFTQYKWFFWIAIVIALVTLWAITNLLHSSYGRNWRAARNNAVAASLAGINVARGKIFAFTVSSALASLAGALFAMLLGIVTPTAFPLTLSFTIMTGAVLAGVGNLAGSIVGAVVLVAIPEVSGALATHLGSSEKLTSNLPGLVTSVLLIIVVLFMPQGLRIRNVRRGKTTQ